MHTKLYIFDNTVLVTGANLSDKYFSNRLDRYWVFQENEVFANYCEDFVNSLIYDDKVTSDSYDNLLNSLPAKNTPSDKDTYIKYIHNSIKMFKYEHLVKIKENSNLSCNEYFENMHKYNKYYKLSSKNIDFIEYNQKTKNKTELLNYSDTLNIQEISDNSNNKYYDDKSEHKHNNKFINNNSNNEVFIFPTMQFNALNIQDDYNILNNILDYLIKKQENKLHNKTGNDYFSNNDREVKHIYIATGYMNPDKNILNKLSKLKNIEVKFLTSSPCANSFYNGGIFKKYIPYIYQLILYRLSKFSKNFKCFEYVQENWTFHSKGVWFLDQNKNCVLSLIGSSNYSKLIFIII